MPFIGTQPEVGGYQVLDALTASATASYTLQLNSVNFSPSSANQLLVSLNGVIQKPGSSFTVSGSTLTFKNGGSDQALTSSDSIDFILAMGEPLLVGTPSDGTISANKIATNAVSMDKLATSGTLPALNGSALTGRGMKFIEKTNLTSNVSQIDFNLPAANHDYYKIIGFLHNINDNVYLQIQFFDHLLNLTNGLDYHWARSKTLAGSITGSGGGNGAAPNYDGLTVIAATSPVGASGPDENGVSFELMIGPTNTNAFSTQVLGQAFLHDESSNAELIGIGGGLIDATKTFGGVRFSFSGGEIGSNSELYVYGMGKS